MTELENLDLTFGAVKLQLTVPFNPIARLPMTTPDLDQLKTHRANLFACEDFEAFRKAQIRFVDLLIDLLEKEDEELRGAARTILGLD